MSDLIKIDFYGDEIHALNLAEVRIVVRRICENLGCDPQTQIDRLKREAWASCQAIPATAADGKTYSMVTIPLRAVPMWLAGINAERVAPHVREKLIRYQIEAADVLARHFTPEAVPVPFDPNDDRVIAMVLAGRIERVKQLEAQVKVLAADLTAAEEIVAEASDAVTFSQQVRAGDAEVTLTRAAVILQWKRKKLIDRLLNLRLIYRDRNSGDLSPMSQYRPRYFSVKYTSYVDSKTGETKQSETLLVTREGIYWIARKLNAEPCFDVPEAAE